MPWGDDVILSDKRYFLPFLARAMTYVDVNTLSRDTLHEICSSFPTSHRLLRSKSCLSVPRCQPCTSHPTLATHLCAPPVQYPICTPSHFCLPTPNFPPTPPGATIKLSLRRHLIEAARWVKETGGEASAAMVGDFVDQVHDAAGAGGLTKARARSVNMAVQLDQKRQSCSRTRSRSSFGSGGRSSSPLVPRRASREAEGEDVVDDERGLVDGRALESFMARQDESLNQLREEMRSLQQLVARLAAAGGAVTGLGHEHG